MLGALAFHIFRGGYSTSIISFDKTKFPWCEVEGPGKGINGSPYKKGIVIFPRFSLLVCVVFFLFFPALGKGYDVVANFITQSEFQFQCLNAWTHDSYIAVLAFPSP